MSNADNDTESGADDPEAAGFGVELPVVATAPEGLPGSLELGVFSLSLSVADLALSRDFYEKLGFEVTGGVGEEGWLILKNSETTLGLFSGMFEGNMLTFNPGLTPRMERIESFTDVREIAATLEAAGVEMTDRPEDGSTGPGSVILSDPDGNQILIDQFF